MSPLICKIGINLNLVEMVQHFHSAAWPEITIECDGHCEWLKWRKINDLWRTKSLLVYQKKSGIINVTASAIELCIVLIRDEEETKAMKIKKKKAEKNWRKPTTDKKRDKNRAIWNNALEENRRGIADCNTS